MGVRLKVLQQALSQSHFRTIITVLPSQRPIRRFKTTQLSLMSFTAQGCLTIVEVNTENNGSGKPRHYGCLLPYSLFTLASQLKFAACHGSENLSSSREPIANEHIGNQKVLVSGVRTLRSIGFWNGLPESLIPSLIHQW